MLESSQVAEAAAVEPVFVGIDWGNAHHQLCIVDTTGKIVDQGKYPHDVAGLGHRTDRLRRHGQVVGISIERAEGLLVDALQQQGHLLFCVSPKMSARARERYRLAPGKSDAFDAFVPSPTRCGTSIATGARCPCPHRCWRSCAH